MTHYPEIAQLLPHDAPMILVDRAVDIQAESIHCQVDIGPHNLFFDPQTGTLPAYVGIEFMAQSVAAWSGYHARQDGVAPPIGFLLGCRRYVAHSSHFTAQQVIDIYAERLMEDNGMAVFSARLEHQGEALASCQLNVFVPSEDKLHAMQIRS